MRVVSDSSLLPYNTFGIDVKAKTFIEYYSLDELRQVLKEHKGEQILHIGQGSNLLFTRNFNGIILHSGMARARFLDDETVEAQNGLRLDDLIAQLTDMQYCGMEKLSLIPGEVGASAVQNVGAYGCEAKDVILRVNTLNVETLEERVFTNEECRFGYRDSIFKKELKGQYIVWSVTFRLSRTFTPDLRYKAIADAIASSCIETPTPQQLADTIASVRWAKLPRPEETGSAGSFFKNPVVDATQYERLKAEYPDMVAYPAADGYKLAAGWLIEHTGWKGRSLGRCGVYSKQALVLVNLGGCTGQEVINLADAVTADVYKKFGITLEKEAIIL